MDGSRADAVPEARGRRARWVAIVVAVLLLAGGVVAWLALRGSSDEQPVAEPSSTPTTAGPSPSEEPTPTPTPTLDPAIFALPPQQVWEVAVADLVGTADSDVTLAAEDPLDRANVTNVVVLAARAGTSSVVIGLDRLTGAELWRQDLAVSRTASCFVLGDGRRTGCTAAVSDDSPDHRVVVLDTVAGTVLGDDTVPYRPWHLVGEGDDIVVAGNNTQDGRLMVSRGTSTDVDRVWTYESPTGFVPATEYWGWYASEDGKAAFTVSGASMLVDLRTGEAQTGLASEDGLLALWPQDVIVRAFDDGSDARATVARPDGTTFEIDGSLWAREGVSPAMTDVIGAGSTAYDARTGAQLWTATERSDALSTNYVVASDVAVQTSWYEESAQMVGLDLVTGAERWTASSRSYSAIDQHGSVLFFGSSWELTAVDAVTGEKPWQLSYESDAAGDDSPWLHTVQHVVTGDSLVTASYGIVRGSTFTR